MKHGETIGLNDVYSIYICIYMYIYTVCRSRISGDILRQLFDSGHLNLVADVTSMLVPACWVILGPKVAGMIQLQTHLD